MFATGISVGGGGPVAYAAINNSNFTLELRLYSAGTLASPGTAYHSTNVNYRMIQQLSGGSGTNAHRAGWQWSGVPIHIFGAVGGGADLSAIKFVTLVAQRSLNAPILGIGEVDFTPYVLSAPATGVRVDDAPPTWTSYVRPLLESVGGFGMFNGGASVSASAGYGAVGRMSIAQVLSAIAVGHQAIGQAGLTEAVAASLQSALDNYSAEKAQALANGFLDDIADTSYHSLYSFGFGINSEAKERLGFRTQMRADFGNANFPQWYCPQLWPPPDPYNIRAHDMAGPGGPGGTTIEQAVEAQMVAHEACRGPE